MEVESSAAQLATHPPSGRALPSEHYVERVMPPVLGTADLTAIFFAAIFYLTNSATAATAGVVSFLYWLICGVAFFLPCVLSTAQLGLLFPYEGALYNWTYRTLGTFWGFFAAFCAWLPGILALVSGFGTAITYLQGLHQGWLTAPWQQGAVLALLILIGTALTVQPLRVLQSVLNVTVGLLLLAVLLITVAAFVWLWTGHTSATTFGHLDDWRPGPDNFVLFGFLIQSYLGTEVPLALAGEVRPSNVGRPFAPICAGAACSSSPATSSPPWPCSWFVAHRELLIPSSSLVWSIRLWEESPVTRQQSVFSVFS